MSPPGRRQKGSRRGGRSGSRFWPYIISTGVGVVIAALLIGLLALRGDGGGGGGGGGPVILPSPRPTDIAQDGHLLGSAGAPVTIIEYADFQ
jgi:hypothetical protein